MQGRSPQGAQRRRSGAFAAERETLTSAEMEITPGDPGSRGTMETAQHPAEPEGPSGRPPSSLQERVKAVFGPVAELLERLETPRAPGSSGTSAAPRLEAVRALLDGQVCGEWEDLAKLLVDPAALVRRSGPTGTLAAPVLPDDPRAFFYEDYRLGVVPPAPEPPPAEPEEQITEPIPASAAEIAEAALTGPPACLVRAADGPERTALLAGIVRELAEAGRRALLLAPSGEQAAGLLAALRDMPQVGVLAAEPSGDPERPDALTELRRLRRELLTLEQWPRDRAALEELRAHDERRRAELAAAEQRLAEEIEAAGRRIETADQESAQAREHLAEAAQEHDRLAAEAERARASWRDLQDIADHAAREADARTREADALEARHRDLAEQALRCEQELEAARDRRAQLTDELERARAALPEATRETEQLAAAAANATAEQHASYYRLAAAESAHAAQRRRLSWGQRLHVVPLPPEVEQARQLIKQRRREAQEAAERARSAVEAHRRAEALRGGLTRFMAEAEQELAALGRTQEQLTERLAALVAERDAVHADIQRLSPQVAEAVEHAAQTASAARQAGRLAAEAEQRAAAARQTRDEAAAAAERAAAEAAEARSRLAALESELEGHRADAAAQIADLESELRALTEAEEHSRARVRQICGTFGEVSPESLEEQRARTMARIEELAAVLESADLLHATPLGFGRGPYSRGASFDTLIALEADRIGDADLLIGAVRARRWILVADGAGRPPLPDEGSRAVPDLDPAVRRAAADHLARSAFERCLDAAPALCRDLVTADATLPLSALEEPDEAARTDAAAAERPVSQEAPGGEGFSPVDDEQPSVRPDDPTRALPASPAGVPSEGASAGEGTPADETLPLEVFSPSAEEGAGHRPGVDGRPAAVEEDPAAAPPPPGERSIAGSGGLRTDAEGGERPSGEEQVPPGFDDSGYKTGGSTTVSAAGVRVVSDESADAAGAHPVEQARGEDTDAARPAVDEQAEPRAGDSLSAPGGPAGEKADEQRSAADEAENVGPEDATVPISALAEETPVEGAGADEQPADRPAPQAGDAPKTTDAETGRGERQAG